MLNFFHLIGCRKPFPVCQKDISCGREMFSASRKLARSENLSIPSWKSPLEGGDKKKERNSEIWKEGKRACLKEAPFNLKRAKRMSNALKLIHSSFWL